MDYKIADYTIIVDTREQHPFEFRGYTAPAKYRDKEGNRIPLIIPVEVATLKTGDYSIKGYEEVMAIERKSLQDAYSTWCHGKDRFERELERLNVMPAFSGVFVEADFYYACRNPPSTTQYSGASFAGQTISWEISYRNVNFRFWDSRNECEKMVWKYLEHTWKHIKDGRLKL